MESRLMFNIRCESADEDIGMLERLIEAALLAENPFSFYPEIIRDGRESIWGELLRREAPPHAHLLPTRPFLFPHPSVNWGHPLTAVPGGEWHPLSGVVPAVSPLLGFFPTGSEGRAIHPFVALVPGSYR